MKKFLYANFTKIFAYILIAVTAVLVMQNVSGVMCRRDPVYNFEESDVQSYKVSHELLLSSNIIMNELSRVYKERKDAETENPAALAPADEGTAPAAPENAVQSENPPAAPAETEIEELSGGRYGVIYYASIYDRVYTNDKSLQQAMWSNNMDYAVLVRRTDGKLTVEKGNSDFNFYYDNVPKDDFVLYVRLTDECVNEIQTMWEMEKRDVMYAIRYTVFSGAVVLLLLIYLLITCGRRKDGTLSLCFADKWYVEITVGAAAVLFTAFCGAAVSVMMFSEAQALTYDTRMALYAAVTPLLLLSVFLFLCLVRNIKAKTLRSRSLIVCIFNYLRSERNAAYSALKKGGAQKPLGTVFALLTLYTAGSVWLTFMTGSAIPAIILLLCFCLYIAKRLDSVQKIVKGIYEISAGNTDYKIDGVTDFFSPIAGAVNSLADGMGAAVEKRMRSERMKTELITNVSHDLKTPLTSIISYAELLTRENLTPECANEYADIILKKSQKLKTLVTDLFDISKVQSKNADINCTEIDAAQLLKQTLGELDEEIEKSGFEMCVNMPEGLKAFCDGARLSRVLENLVLNALKYSMPNTRIYIDARSENQKCVIEIKNISAKKPDFDPQYITGRFVRGDESRHEDGNGLGLAIAKSYTEACGGTFNIILDGDLFKAVIKLPESQSI